MKYDVNDENWIMFNRYELVDYPKYLSMYDMEYEKLCSLYSDLPYGKSMNELYYTLEYSKLENESTYLFPGDIVYFYPIIEVLKARKMHTCYASGALIYPGSEYMHYKAFLYNKSRNKSYVTPSIDLEVGTDFECPLTLEDFEVFCSRVDISYECSLDAEYNILTSLHSPLIRSLKRHK